MSVVTVTGVSGDIGAAVADVFAGHGYELVGWDIHEPARSTAKVLRRFVACDLRTEIGVAEAQGSLNDLACAHLIAVAGGGDVDELSGEPVSLTIDQFDSVLRTNLVTAYAGIKAALPALVRSDTDDRSITLVSSINAFGGFGAPAYSAAKAGLGGLCRALAPPLGKLRIRINVIAFGTVDTTNIRRLAQVRGVTFSPERISRRVPLGRIADPDDAASAIAAVALFMKTTTGSVIVADGGQGIAAQ